MKKLNILIYKISGKQLFFNVPKSVCEECDLSVAMVKKVAKRVNGNKISIKVRPWFNYLPQALLKGGWHPPIVLVNGKIFSQGIVPDEKKLESRIRQEAENL